MQREGVRKVSFGWSPVDGAGKARARCSHGEGDLGEVHADSELAHNGEEHCDTVDEGQSRAGDDGGASQRQPAEPMTPRTPLLSRSRDEGEA